jgi:phage regulator Rha-like protein
MALAAEDRGGDAFMVAAIRGDILAEMSRHGEAAESYDRALRLEPDDHWILHQAAIAHSRAGNDDRAADLFEQALRHDRDGCHQTLVDYGDLLRRVGPHRRRRPHVPQGRGRRARAIPTGAASCAKPSASSWPRRTRGAARPLAGVGGGVAEQPMCFYGRNLRLQVTIAASMPDQHVVPLERVERSILILRGHRVILDSDLAALYGVPVKRLNEQVKRNIDRFPDDFAFTLTEEEHEALRSQFATLKTGRGEHRKYLPRAFTEHGALMAASVLNSPKAVEMSILVVRAFVRLRQILASNRQLAAKLNELERKIAAHDKNIVALFQTVRSLMAVPEKPKRRIGFNREGA